MDGYQKPGLVSVSLVILGAFEGLCTAFEAHYNKLGTIAVRLRLLCVISNRETLRGRYVL